MKSHRIVYGAARGAIGAMSMTGARALAAQFGLLDTGTPPESVAKQGVPQLMRSVPSEMRPAVVNVMHIAYGAGGGAVYSLMPRWLRRRRYSGPVFGMLLWLGYLAGVAPMLGLRIERQRSIPEWGLLAVDHVLYGLVVSRFGGRR